jgi:hypothetical protein
VSFPTGSLLDTTGWTYNVCPSSGPDAYLTTDSVRYVWMSGANNGTKVYLGTAHASGLGLGPQRLVHPGQPLGRQQNFPRIAGHADTLGVVWQQSQSGQQEILFAWSVTGPEGLGTPDTVNVDLAGAQRTPDIAYANGTFHIVWSEGPSQVRYRAATIVGGVGVPEPAAERVQVWPDPATDRLWMSGSWLQARVLDATGRLLLEAPLGRGGLDVQALPAGTYVLHLRDAGRGEGVTTFRKH